MSERRDVAVTPVEEAELDYIYTMYLTHRTHAPRDITATRTEAAVAGFLERHGYREVPR